VRAPILGLLPHQVPSHSPRTRVARQARPPPFQPEARRLCPRAPSRPAQSGPPSLAHSLTLPLSCGARLSATAKPDSTPAAREATLFICAQSAHLPCQRSDVASPAGADELRYRCLTVNPLRGGGAGQPNSSQGAFQITCSGSRSAGAARQGGEGVSAHLRSFPFHCLRGKRAKARAA
jgi:hypothetical protein